MKEVKKKSNALNNKLIDDFLSELKLKNYSANTINNYSIDLNNFLEFINSFAIYDFNEVSNVTARNYNTFLNKEKNYSPSSRNRKLSSIRMFYDYLIENNRASYNYFHSIKGAKKAKRLPRFIYDETINKILNSIDKKTIKGQRDYMIISLLYGTGIRVGELCRIKIDDCDFYKQNILIHGKGNKMRMVPLYDRLNQELKNYTKIRSRFLAISQANYENLFLNMKGMPLSERGVRVIINEIITHLEDVSHVSPHMFRHSFATSLLNNGADIRSVQEILGHENLSSTEIYADVTVDTLMKSYDKVFEEGKKK